jgi:hypothetical protein
MHLATRIGVAAFIMLALSSQGQAATNQTPRGNEHQCLLDPGGEGECEGLVCYCCYLTGTVKGCWICDNEYHDCVWDPAYRSILNGSGLGRYVRPPSSSKPPATIAPAK